MVQAQKRGTTADILRQIILHELELKDTQIWIYGESYKIPPEDGLFCVIEYKYSKPYSSRLLTPVDGENLLSEQNLNTQEFMTVQLFSRNRDADFRKEEAAMALNSIYAQQLGEQLGFRVSMINPIQNMTALEGSAMLKRYDISVTVLSWYQKSAVIAFFDSLRVKVLVNDGEPPMKAEFDQPVTNPV